MENIFEIKYLYDIKKYSTESVINFLSKKDREYLKLILSHKSKPPNYYLENYKINVFPWYFSKIVYDNCIFSNDYKRNILEKETDFIKIYISFYNQYNKDTEKWLNQIETNLQSKIMYGHTQEQGFFSYYFIYECINRFNREYFIMLNQNGFWLNKIDDIFIEKFNLTLNEFIHSIIRLIYITLDEPNINIALKSITNQNYKQQINNLVEVLACDYEDCKNSTFKDLIFYSKPIIHTNKEDYYYVFSMCLFFKYFSESIYWTVRDFYYYKGNNNFVTEYGKIFENYVYDILIKQYGDNHVKKIERKKYRTADYLIETKDNVIIIEVKSVIAKIDCKKQNLNINSFEEFEKKIDDAKKQIESTLINYNLVLDNKQPYGMIVCFDNIISPQTLVHDMKYENTLKRAFGYAAEQFSLMYSRRKQSNAFTHKRNRQKNGGKNYIRA